VSHVGGAVDLGGQELLVVGVDVLHLEDGQGPILKGEQEGLALGHPVLTHLFGAEVEEERDAPDVAGSQAHVLGH
jgi:hypothetical protein